MKLLLMLGLLLLILAWPASAQAQSVKLAPPTGPVFSGTKSCGTGGAAIVTGATPVLSVVVRNSDATLNILLGGSGSQDFTLTPGLSLAFDVRDLSQVYCRTSSSTATLEFFAVKGP